MIEAGLQLMLLGMSVVFVFLVILVALMTVMSAITRRFEPPEMASTATSPSPIAHTGSSGTQDSPQIAAVLAAVAQHHRRRGGDTAHAHKHTSGDHT
jgi:oxaloacetate decarboxylase gamma subunit